MSKLDTTGKLIYSTYLGGSGFTGPDATFEGDSGMAIAVDAKGDAYVTGSTGSRDFPLKNSFQSINYAGGTSACLPCFTVFVTKLTPAGNALMFSTYLGGHGFLQGDIGRGIAVDKSEYVYVTGSTDSSDFPTRDGFENTEPGQFGTTNAFVIKFEPSGTELVYSTYLGGNNGGSGIAIDASGSAYITGGSTSPDLPTQNAFQSKLKGYCYSKFLCNSSAFVTKFSPAGDHLSIPRISEDRVTTPEMGLLLTQAARRS